MLMQLTPLQARIIGVLLEKEITTPDQYPLSLNSLTLGCNQKSNRDPVMHLTESEVQNTLDELRVKKLIFEQTSSGSRVTKYKHRFCNTEFSDLKFSRQQLAIICVTLLRGPQTPGELRTRTNRLAEFANVDEVETSLNTLQALNDLQLVTKLEREPGKRESRYAHLFCGP
ncbi:MAG: YceH family protein, partial [Paraglaciecola sp.]|uniref:YceH family protein n=1 Tax=Paraglaciecola sp. TaxID=1920173 RepID=UPI0032999B45